jgi:hypothetical protein
LGCGRIIGCAAEHVNEVRLKRQKDLADISRLLEAHPGLRGRVPQDVLARLI